MVVFAGADNRSQGVASPGDVTAGLGDEVGAGDGTGAGDGGGDESAVGTVEAWTDSAVIGDAEPPAATGETRAVVSVRRARRHATRRIVGESRGRAKTLSIALGRRTVRSRPFLCSGAVAARRMKALHLVLAVLVALPAVGAGAAVDGSVAGPADAGRTPDAPAVASPVPGTPPGPHGPRTVAQIDPPPSPPWTVNVLGIRSNATNRSGFQTAEIDLGPALTFDSGGTSHRLETLQAIERVQATESDAERTRRLRAELARIEQRTVALRRTQRAAFGAYVQDRATAQELLIRLARIDRTTRALQERRTRLWGIANRTGAGIADERFTSLDRKLDVYTGPVRERAAASLAGESPARRFYVSATPRGIMLATLTENTYLREAYRGDLRGSGNGEVNGNHAAAAVEREYPEAWAARQQTAVEGGEVARVRVDYAGGMLETLVSGANGRVFADEHRQSLSIAGTNTTAVNTRDGLQLTVNRTYVGGPMRLEIRDEAGNRVNASVTVGPAGGRSAAIGYTGEDGVLWTLTPSERFTVVGIRDQSVVFLTMEPLEAPRPGERNATGS